MFLTNVLIESFCIHARNLDDFFPGQNGSRAADFTEATYESERGHGLRKALATKINTQIAHLTDRRTKSASQKIGTEDRKEIFETLMAA